MDMTMNAMNVSQMSGWMAPAWLVYSLSAIFFAGTLFYLYRLARPGIVKKTYGHYDWQNEIGHGICMLAMAFALAPAALQLPSWLWAITLGSGGAFFLARALTWGRKLPYNVWWWDWAHVGMLLGMALMFLPVHLGYFVYAVEAFWLWFAAYYMYSLCHDVQDAKTLYLGSDLSHLLMGAVMFIMTAAPMALMPPGAGMFSMPGMICSGATQSPDSANRPAGTDMQSMPKMSMPGMDMSGSGMAPQKP